MLFLDRSETKRRSVRGASQTRGPGLRSELMVSISNQIRTFGTKLVMCDALPKALQIP